jgi:hypothetical protein
MRIIRSLTKAHVAGIALGLVMGVVALNVLVPRIPRWMGLRAKPPSAPFVIHADM